jgi:hypothetical protein
VLPLAHTKSDHVPCVINIDTSIPGSNIFDLKTYWWSCLALLIVSKAHRVFPPKSLTVLLLLLISSNPCDNVSRSGI